MVLAHLQNQVQLPDTSSVKKVPAAERDSKMAIIRRKLTGLLIEGPMEPGHHLLDLAAHMYQTNEIRYIAPERCISRTHEVMTQKVPTKQLDVAADSLVVKEKSDVTDMVVTSALQVQEALQRRGLALVFADVIMHDAYTRYLTTLFSHLHREPPPGYSRCTVSQLVAADKMVWQTLLEEGVRPRRDESGDLALNGKLLEALQSYRVSFSLLPLLAKASTATGSSSSTTKTKGGAGGKGSPFPVQKPWVKNKGGKASSKGKMRVPQHIFKMGALHQTQLENQFALLSTALLDVQMQLTVHDVAGAITFVRSVTMCTQFRSIRSQLDYLQDKQTSQVSKLHRSSVIAQSLIMIFPCTIFRSLIIQVKPDWPKSPVKPIQSRSLAIIHSLRMLHRPQVLSQTVLSHSVLILTNLLFQRSSSHVQWSLRYFVEVHVLLPV